MSADKPQYPRGIINPNYPGFQHLAHTLSEHFVDHHGNQTGSMSDSDFSEVDSDFPSEGHSASNNNTIACDDSNGNNIIEEKVTNKSDTLSKIEEILRTVFESNSNHLSTVIEMFAEKELADDQSDTESLALTEACDLKTYLDHYEDTGITIAHIEPFSKKVESPLNEPDIIKKSNSCERALEQSVDKPDILLDVAEDATTGGEKEEPGSAWSITPVDIVGNFEQEVERELGLLVTGYKNNFNSDEKMNKEATGMCMTKVTDAVLSGASDSISKANAMVSIDRMQKEGGKGHIPTAIVKPKYQRSSFDDRQLPTSAYMNDDHTAWYDKHAIELSNAPIMTATHPKKIPLPEFDRKAKKHMKACVKSAHNAAETAHNKPSIDTSDAKETVCRAVAKRSVAPKTKKPSASVAVVQPRKKERMDERKLMETILQMQIKKNALLYSGNNNKPVAPIRQSIATMKCLNNNNITNNNNDGENYMNSNANQARKDLKENSGMLR